MSTSSSTNSVTITEEGLIEKFRADRLSVYIYQSRQEMGTAAATAVASEMRRLIAGRGRTIGIFASAQSQKEFLKALVDSTDIEWTRVVGFHLDEYLGMSEESPQSFRRFLHENLVWKVPIAEFHGLRGEAANATAVCANYAALLKSRPPDFAALGIGENGHLAFIDPRVCDFNDPSVVRVVDLDGVCREQQVHDGAFAKIDEVPTRAISLTIPTIMACPRLFAIVPGIRKRQAVYNTIKGEISPACPASILRTHPDAHLFLDRDAGEIIRGEGMKG